MPSLHLQAMPDNTPPLIDRIAPLHGSTEESARYHEARMLAERAANGLDPQGNYVGTARDAQLLQVRAIELLTMLVGRYGLRRVQTWLRNIAAIKGESL